MNINDIPNRVKVHSDPSAVGGRSFVAFIHYDYCGTYRQGLIDLHRSSYTECVEEFKDIVLSDYVLDSRITSATIYEVVNGVDQPVQDWYDVHALEIELAKRIDQDKNDRALYEELKKKYG